MEKMIELSKDRQVINYQNCGNKKMTINVLFTVFISPYFSFLIEIVQGQFAVLKPSLLLSQ